MKTNTGDVVEELAAGIAHLEEQRRAAEAEAERATERLKELSARRAALAPGASSDEKEVAGELAALVAGSGRGGCDPLPHAGHRRGFARELDRLILEVEVRHREGEKRLARERYEALCKERYSLDSEAEKVVASLLEILERLEGLYAEQVHAAAAAEDPSLAQQDPRGTIEQWLARRLRHWLSLASLEKYDAPLPELDPLALKPEPDEEPGKGT